MAFLDPLRTLLDRVADRAPAPPPGVAVGAPAGPDEAEMVPLHRRVAGIWEMDGIERVDDDLWGITFAIEYLDSKRQQTTRRVSMRHLYREPGGRVYLYAYCHEREAPRTFRFDRIVSVIDLDGVVWPPDQFFRDELRVVLPEGWQDATAPAPSAPAAHQPAAELATEMPSGVEPAPTDKPGVAQRRLARDGLRILCAISRSDGVMHPAEVDAILDYIAQAAARAGVPTDEADRAALEAYVKRQRPPREVVSDCLRRMEAAANEDRRHLVRAAVRLIDADGEQHPAEFEALVRLKEALAL